MAVSLYPDQADLVGRVRGAMRRGHKKILMQSSTGSGKTRMALDMIVGAQSKGSSAIFTVPRTELLEQTMETIGGYGIPFGGIAPGYTPNPLSGVNLAMTPTLARRLDRTKPPTVLFIDESHYGGADLDRIMAWATAAGSWIIGLSATPMKTNGKPMGDWYDHMEMGLQTAELIRLGRLSQFRYFAPSAPDLGAVKVRDGEYVLKQISELMEQETAIIGDAAKTYLERAAGKLCLLFATSRKHAEECRKIYAEAGVTAVVIDGTMTKDVRKRIIRGFADREFTVLINVQLLTFGFDLAQAAGKDVRVEALTDLCPRKSLPLQMQVWGRALRVGDEPSIIMDHGNNWREHGFPDSDRHWTLEGGEQKGGKGGKREVKQRQCEIPIGGCGYVAPVGPACCPNCGLMYPVQSRIVETQDGELHEIDRAAAQAAIDARKAEQGQAKSLSDLIELGKRRGMENPRGWALHVLSGRRGKK